MPTVNALKEMSTLSSNGEFVAASHCEGRQQLLARALMGTQSSDGVTVASPAQVLYNLEIFYAMLMPAMSLGDEDQAFSHFQLFFMESDGVSLMMKIVSNNDFLSTADVETRR